MEKLQLPPSHEKRPIVNAPLPDSLPSGCGGTCRGSRAFVVRLLWSAPPWVRTEWREGGGGLGSSSQMWRCRGAELVQTQCGRARRRRRRRAALPAVGAELRESGIIGERGARQAGGGGGGGESEERGRKVRSNLNRPVDRIKETVWIYPVKKTSMSAPASALKRRVRRRGVLTCDT